MARAVGDVWARGSGVTLVRVPALDLDAHPGLARALADGVARNYEGAPPSFPEASERYLLRAGGEVVGAFVLQRACPAPGTAAVLALAIDPARRGAATGVKALLAAERRLAAEGIGRVIARVPRTNGRGLYFMLRAGYTPLAAGAAPRESGDATWFGRRQTSLSNITPRSGVDGCSGQPERSRRRRSSISPRTQRR